MQFMQQAAGLLIKPQGSGLSKATLDRVRLEGNGFGAIVTGNSQATFSNSSATGNLQDGFSAQGGQLNLESCVAANNVGAGIISFAPSKARLTNVTVMNNGMGLNSMPGGSIISFGNNRILGNNVDGGPTQIVPQQ